MDTDPRGDSRARLAAVLRRTLTVVVAALFVALAIALVLGRFPLPAGDSAGYNSIARNLVAIAIAAAVFGTPGLRLSRSPLGDALLAYLAVAAISIAANRGSWGDFRGFATAVGLFHVARTFASGAAGRAWLFHWLGLVVVGIVLREVLADPAILGMRETARDSLVTDHANTIGHACALLGPLFVAGVRWPGVRLAPFAYAFAAILGVAISFSRSAWLALAFALLATALAARVPRRRGAIALPVAGAAAAIAAGTVVLAAGRMSLGRGEADSQRLRVIEASLSLFRDNPVFGIGFGSKNLERVFPARYLEMFGSSLFLFHSHAFPVDAVVGCGILGGIAAAWLLLRVAGLAWRAIRSAGPPPGRFEPVALAASLGVFLAQCFADMPFYHGRLLFLLAVAWALIERRLDEIAGAVATHELSPRNGGAG